MSFVGSNSVGDKLEVSSSVGGGGGGVTMSTSEGSKGIVELVTNEVESRA